MAPGLAAAQASPHLEAFRKKGIEVLLLGEGEGIDNWVVASLRDFDVLGSIVTLRLATSQKPVKVQAIVRDANTQARAFEVVDMELEERAKLRKILVQIGNVQKQTTPKERNRRAVRTILSNPT